MSIAAQQYADLIWNLQWLELIKAFAPVVTSVIAFKALRNWQRQDKAKREAEFLDTILDEMNLYVFELQRPIEIVRMVKIGMKSHVENRSDGTPKEREIKGAINYIENWGGKHSQRLREALSSAEIPLSKLKSLIFKGQIFAFEDYHKAQNAVSVLEWHAGQMQSICMMIEPDSWFWGNEEVVSLLEKILSIEPDEINKSVGENSVNLVRFSRETYSRIYGGNANISKRKSMWRKIKARMSKNGFISPQHPVAPNGSA